VSERLPRITAAQIIKVMKKLGFVLSRQSGSHMIFKNNEGKRITVPFHGKTILHPKVVKSIIEVAGISIEELKKLL